MVSSIALGILATLSATGIADKLRRRTGKDSHPTSKGGEDPAVPRTAIDRAQRTLEIARFSTNPKERKERASRLEQATRELDQSVQAHPTVGELYYWRGRLHEAMGRAEVAQIDYARALEKDARLYDARYRRARIGCDPLLQNPARWSSADLAAAARSVEEDARELTKAGVRREQVVVLETYLLLIRHLPPNVPLSAPPDATKPPFSTLDDALKSNPVFVDALLLRAVLGFVREPASTTKSLLDRAAAVEPNDPRVYQYRIWTNLNPLSRPNLKEILLALEEAVELSPNHASMRLARTLGLGALKLDELARGELDAAVQRAPDSPESHRARAAYWLAQYQAEGSTLPPPILESIRGDVDTAVRLEKEPGYARSLRAQVRRKFLGDPNGAEEDEAVLRNAVDKNQATLVIPSETMFAFLFVTPKWSDDEVRDTALSYAQFLVERVRLGADREELLPRIVALIDRAFQCGAKELDPAFDLVKEDPAVRAVLERQRRD